MIITDLREISGIPWSEAYSLQTGKRSHGDAAGPWELPLKRSPKPKLLALGLFSSQEVGQAACPGIIRPILGKFLRAVVYPTLCALT